MPGMLGHVWDLYLTNCRISFVLYDGQGEDLLLFLGKHLKVNLAQALQGSVSGPDGHCNFGAFSGNSCF